MLIEDRFQRMGAVERMTASIFELALPTIRNSSIDDWRFVADAPRPDLSNIASDGGKILFALMAKPCSTFGELQAYTGMTGSRLLRSLTDMAQLFGDRVSIGGLDGKFITIHKALIDGLGDSFSFVRIEAPLNSEALAEMIRHYELSPKAIQPGRSALAVHLSRVIKRNFQPLTRVEGAIPYEDDGMAMDLRVGFEPTRIHDTASLLIRAAVPEHLSADRVTEIMAKSIEAGLKRAGFNPIELNHSRNTDYVSLFQDSVNSSPEVVLQIGGADSDEVARNVERILVGMLRERQLKLYKPRKTALAA